jgi:hypothetical protein
MTAEYKFLPASVVHLKRFRPEAENFLIPASLSCLNFKHGDDISQCFDVFHNQISN